MKQPNFGSAFDLSTLKKPTNLPANDEKLPGVEATVESLPNELMPLSNTNQLSCSVGQNVSQNQKKP